MNHYLKTLAAVLIIAFGLNQNANAQYSDECEWVVTAGTVVALAVMGPGGNALYRGAAALGAFMAEPSIEEYAAGPCQAADLPDAIQGYFNYYSTYPRGIPPEEMAYSVSIAQDLMLCGCSMETVLGAYFMVDSEREDYLREIGQGNGVTMFQQIYYARPSLNFDPLDAYHEGFNSQSNGGGGGSNYPY